MIAAALCYVLGVYTSSKFSADFLILLFGAYLIIWTVRTFVSRTLSISSIVPVFAFVLGAILCMASYDTGMSDFAKYVGKHVTVTGRVSEIPSVYDDSIQYTVRVKSILHGTDETQTDELMLITSKSAFEYGDSVEFSGIIKEFPQKLNENGFDMLRYYKSKGISVKMYSEAGAYSAEPINDYTLYGLTGGFKNIISQFIDKYNTGDRAAILKAVIIGSKKEISDELYTDLQRTGTLRCLYPAFLHMMIITYIAGLAAGFVPKKRRDIILVAIYVLYAIVNSTNPVFLKVFVLGALTILVKRKFGYSYLPEMLALTVLVLGIANPLILFNGGFVSSVCAGLLTHYFYRHVSKYFKWISSKFIRKSVTISVICLVGTLPLTIYFFGGISLWSVAATAIFIPVTLGIIISFPVVAAMQLIFGSAPVAGGFMNALVSAFIYLPKQMDKLFSSYIIFPKCGLVFILAYAAGIVGLGLRINKMKKESGLAFLVSAALFTSVLAGQIERLGTAEVTFVNVGQGDGAYVTVPYQGSIIIDGGGGSPYSSYNIGEKVFVPYLQSAGINKIEAAFLTHYHKDHAEGVVAAIDNLRVKNVFMPDVMEGSEWRTAIETAAQEHGTKVHYVSENSKVIFDNGLTVEITVPAERTKLLSDDENDTSLLYRVGYGEFSCLFTGDMTSVGERALIDAGLLEDCDVLKAAHHGSKTSTSAQWVEAVSPEYAVISVGENNAYGHPSVDTLKNLEGITVLRTDENGDIKITGDKNGVKKTESYR